MYYCGIQNFKPCYPNLRPSGFGFCMDFKYHLNIRVKGTGGFPISFRDIGQGKVYLLLDKMSICRSQFLEHLSAAYIAGRVFTGQHLSQILACAFMLMDGQVGFGSDQSIFRFKLYQHKLLLFRLHMA